MKVVGEKRLLQLNELDKIKFQAYKNAKLFKEQTKKWHDIHILKKVFKVGNFVLLFNSRLWLFLGKLKSRWSSSFQVVRVFPYGALELMNTKGETFKANGHRCKVYYGDLMPQKKASLALQSQPPH